MTGGTAAPALPSEGALVGGINPVTTALTFFTVTGAWFATTDPAVTAGSSALDVLPISGLVTFTPRLARGQDFMINNFLVSSSASEFVVGPTAVTLEPITAQIYGGVLSTLDYAQCREVKGVTVESSATRGASGAIAVK